MRFCTYLPSLLVLLSFSPHNFAADLTSPASSVSAATSPNDKTTYVEAKVVEGKKDTEIEAHGDVELQQGKQKIFADHVFYNQKTGDLTANGSVRLEQSNETVSGPDLKMNTTTHIGEMTTPTFEFKQSKGNPARGSADLLSTPGTNYYVFDHATYTTCPAGQDDWLVHMTRLELDRDTQVGTAHNAWIQFEGVPILYAPWMDFPLDGHRSSGFLGPVYGNTSSGGTELTVPFYWNIAPNIDYTIAPRVMAQRGTLLENEFRFLEPSSSGILSYNEIQNDRIAQTSRYSYSLQEKQNFGSGLGATVNLNRVSDNNYFQDLATTMQDATQTQLLNEGVLSYSAGRWTATARAQTFQTIQDPLGDIAVPYQSMPQLTLSGNNTFNDVSVSMVSEYVDFRHPTLVEGQRLVLNPSVAYPLLSDPGYYIKPKLGLHYTDYAMGDNNTANIPNATRLLPIFSVDSGINIEKDFNLGKNEYVQTFEPRLFYVKIPYQYQDNLPVYDTTLAPVSFASLFSENRFYGNDRIGDANMATLGFTSRLIDGTGGVERLHVGVAQRFFFQSPLVNQAITPTIPPTPAAPYINSNSDIMLSVGGKLTNHSTLDSLFDYNPINNFTPSGSVTFSYKPETGKLLNLGYSFNQDLIYPLNNFHQDDFSAQWPLFHHWYAVTRLSYSTDEHVFTQRLLGLEYNQSCWTLRLVTQKFWIAAGQTSSGMFIQLELNSLVSLGTDPLSALTTSIPGYSKLNATPAATPTGNSP